MKKSVRLCLCAVLILSTVLCMNVPFASAVTYDEFINGTGETPIPRLPFECDVTGLGLEVISEGADNVQSATVGYGTRVWRATGDFTITFPEPVQYDHRIAIYELDLNMYNADGTYDVVFFCKTAEDTIEAVSYSKERYKDLGRETTAYFLNKKNGLITFNFNDIFAQGKAKYGWNTGYTIECVGVCVRLGTATYLEIAGITNQRSLDSHPADINGDGAVDTADARDLLVATLGGDSGHLNGIDVNRDGVFDTADAREKLVQVL